MTSKLPEPFIAAGSFGYVPCDVFTADQVEAVLEAHGRAEYQRGLEAAIAAVLDLGPVAGEDVHPGVRRGMEAVASRIRVLKKSRGANETEGGA